MHLEGAAAFEADALRFRDNEPGWAIIALFYSALHYARAYLVAAHDENLVSHDDMESAFRNHPEIKPAKPAYKHLKEQSEGRRYYLETFLPRDVANLHGDLEKVKRLLNPKTERCLALLEATPASAPQGVERPAPPPMAQPRRS